MRALRVLILALYVQVILGLVRFALPYLGLWLDERVWQIHSPNGLAIAIAALVLFRPLPGVPNTRTRVAARFVALLPLLLGLAIGFGLIGGVWVAVAHMVVGFAAVRVMGTAIMQQQHTVAAPADAAAIERGV